MCIHTCFSPYFYLIIMCLSTFQTITDWPQDFRFNFFLKEKVGLWGYSACVFIHTCVHIYIFSFNCWTTRLIFTKLNMNVMPMDTTLL
jgi:hypothetical protein